MKCYQIALLKLALVHFSFCVPSSHILQECTKKWDTVPLGKSDVEWQCSRMKAQIKCAIAPGQELPSGAMRDTMFYTFLDSTFLNKHEMCNPEIDLHALRDILQKSGAIENHKDYLLDKYNPASCAKEVVTKCIIQYNKIYPTGKVCAAFQGYIYCLRSEAEGSSCDAPIMTHLIRAAESIAQNAVDELNRENPEGCNYHAPQ